MKKANKYYLKFSRETRKREPKEVGRTLAGILALTGVVLLGDAMIKNAPRIKEAYTSYIANKVEEINREDYLKLRKYVIGNEKRTPIPEQGWRFYTELLFREYPNANKLGSFNEWSNFLKIYNGGGDPKIGQEIDFPILKKNSSN